MPALIADAHNSDGVVAGIPHHISKVATLSRNFVEFRALAASIHNFRVRTTVFAPVLTAVYIPALQHYVELLVGEPLAQLILDGEVAHLPVKFPHPHSILGARSNPHPQTG